MNIRVGVYAPFPTDITSWYRCWGVLTEKSIREAGITVVDLNEKGAQDPMGNISWKHTFAQCDVVFLQRPCNDQHFGVLRQAKIYGKPIWIDYDDDLFSVTKDNPTYSNYGRIEAKACVQKIIEAADIVSASTDHLAKKLSAFNPKTVVVPNALNLGFTKPMDHAIARNKCVVWRGSHCHREDLRHFSDVMLEAYNMFPEWGWFFYGDDPYWITERMDPKRVHVYGFAGEFPLFMDNLKKMRGAIHIAPLVDNEFNRSKSRIAHLESSCAGSVCIAPDWEEWQGGEMFRYKDKAEFRSQFFKALQTPVEQLAEMNRRDWSWVQENRDLRRINARRIEIIKSLVPDV